MEYLIRQFDVHVHEKDKLILTFMHYHNTPLYTKLLQNIDMKNAQLWYHPMLEPVQRGDLFTRSQLLKYTKHYIFVFDELFQLVLDYLKYHKQYTKSSSYVITSSSVNNT